MRNYYSTGTIHFQSIRGSGYQLIIFFPFIFSIHKSSSLPQITCYKRRQQVCVHFQVSGLSTLFPYDILRRYSNCDARARRSIILSLRERHLIQTATQRHSFMLMLCFHCISSWIVISCSCYVESTLKLYGDAREATSGKSSEEAWPCTRHAISCRTFFFSHSYKVLWFDGRR